jgi:tetratricopeptide (TPR) repeat protein
MSSGTRRASGSLALLLLAATGPGLAGGGGAAGASQDAGQAAAPEVEARPLDAWGAALEAAQADPDAREVWLELLARESLGFDRQVAANGWAFELAESGDLEGALRIQSILHERLDAEWTLTNLAVSLTRLGRLDETRERLNDFLGRQPRSGTAWNYLGQAELGAGRVAAARAAWARAVVCGSDGATVSLARLALDSGRTASARAGFRVGVDRRPAGAWSLRGWALTCLPGSL